jgi:hypothetical protein
MATLAANFVRFRFKRCRLVFKPNSGTNQNGGVTIGFAADPTKTIAQGPTASRQAFNLTNAVDAPLFVLSQSDAAIERNPAWLKITDTGDDLNTTEQGTFFIVTNAVPTLTQALQIPLYLDYEIEFLEAASPPAPPAIAWPETKFLTRTNGGMPGGGQMGIAIVTGEVQTLPAITTNAYYNFVPEVELISIYGDTVSASGVVYNGTGWQFYESYKDFEKLTPLVYLACAADTPQGNQNVPRTSIQLQSN